MGSCGLFYILRCFQPDSITISSDVVDAEDFRLSRASQVGVSGDTVKTKDHKKIEREILRVKRHKKKTGGETPLSEPLSSHLQGALSSYPTSDDCCTTYTPQRMVTEPVNLFRLLRADDSRRKKLHQSPLNFTTRAQSTPVFGIHKSFNVDQIVDYFVDSDMDSDDSDDVRARRVNVRLSKTLESKPW